MIFNHTKSVHVYIVFDRWQHGIFCANACSTIADVYRRAFAVCYMRVKLCARASVCVCVYALNVINDLIYLSNFH